MPGLEDLRPWLVSQCGCGAWHRRGSLGGLLLVCAAGDGQVQPERADSWVPWTPA